MTAVTIQSPPIPERNPTSLTGDKKGTACFSVLRRVEKIDLDFNQQDLAKFLRYKHFAPVAAGVAPDGPHDLVVVVRQSLTGRMATSTHRIVPN